MFYGTWDLYLASDSYNVSTLQKSLEMCAIIRLMRHSERLSNPFQRKLKSVSPNECEEMPEAEDVKISATLRLQITEPITAVGACMATN